MKAVFLDRDGTVNVGIPKYDRVDSIDKVELLPKTLEGLSILAQMDYGVFFVTNQAGIAEGLINHEDFHIINSKVLELIEPSGIQIIETYYCPHRAEEDCDCQKPRPAMLLQAANKYDIDLKESYMIGDRLTDIHTGINANTKTILVKTGKNVEAKEADYTATDLVDAVRYIQNQ